MTLRSLLHRFNPRVGVQAQLAGAGFFWLAAATILLARGVQYTILGRPGGLLVLGAIGLGLFKSGLVLDRAAEMAVARIHARGTGCFFGFFSWRAWSFVLVMMGAGILLRHEGLRLSWMAFLYLAVGTGLALADRVFWKALLRRPVSPPAAGAGEA